MSLDLNTVLAELGIEDSREVLEPHWEDSLASLPSPAPQILEPAEISANRAFVGLPPEVEPLLLETAKRVRATPPLLHLAWHCHELLFRYADYDGQRVGRWPSLEETLGEQAGAFYILVAMGVVPLTRAMHQSRGVPEEVTHNSVCRFMELVHSWRNVHGSGWGLPLRVLYWLRHYVVGDLYTLGRMEYMVRPFGGRIQAYRSRETNEVLALAQAGTHFRPDGFIDAAPREDDGGWTSRLVEDEEAVTGCPISPAGMGVRAEVRLPLSRWRRVLAPGDPVLDTHIPGGGGMTPERCEDTMRRALEFFPRYFPERPFVGFACGSWILNPQLEEFYSPTSNMVLWQHELYLFPIPSGDRSGVYFVFGKDDVDPATAPRDTSVRRAMLDQIARGGRLIAEGMFFLTEDFERYGTQVYRSHWPPSDFAGLA